MGEAKWPRWMQVVGDVYFSFLGDAYSHRYWIDVWGMVCVIRRGRVAEGGDG